MWGQVQNLLELDAGSGSKPAASLQLWQVWYLGREMLPIDSGVGTPNPQLVVLFKTV